MSSLNPSPAPWLRAPFTLRNLAVGFLSASQQACPGPHTEMNHPPVRTRS